MYKKDHHCTGRTAVFDETKFLDNQQKNKNKSDSLLVAGSVRTSTHFLFSNVTFCLVFLLLAWEFSFIKNKACRDDLSHSSALALPSPWFEEGRGVELRGKFAICLT